MSAVLSDAPASSSQIHRSACSQSKRLPRSLASPPIWFWQHRHDPDVPKPLRLGDASNPKSPLRYREAELLRYIERKQRATDALRVGNQFPSQAK